MMAVPSRGEGPEAGAAASGDFEGEGFEDMSLFCTHVCGYARRIGQRPLTWAQRGYTMRHNDMAPAKKDPDDVKSTFLKVRVTSERLERWKEAAAKAKAAEDSDDLDFSEWARRALNQAMEAEAAARAAKRKGGR
jgi:hypothetical protein